MKLDRRDEKIKDMGADWMRGERVEWRGEQEEKKGGDNKGQKCKRMVE